MKKKSSHENRYGGKAVKDRNSRNPKYHSQPKGGKENSSDPKKEKFRHKWKNEKKGNFFPGKEKERFPNIDFDDYLVSKFGAEFLQKLAHSTQVKINNLLAGKATAEDLGILSTTQHGESRESNKNITSKEKNFSKLQPTKSYLKTKKENFALESTEKTGPQIKEEIQKPTRGFALAKYKKELELKEEISTSKSNSINKLEETKLTTPAGMTLDEWQFQALQALLAGKNVIVDAPTSAGKTRVIEALLEYRLPEGIKLIYTSPVKSLSNDKYREFSEKYGREKVGINTGDFKENLTAPIMLATLETYRNSLLGIEPNMNRRVVVYDEYHFLQDESRGSAWEESLILTPKDSQLVLLSASVPNSEDFAAWIQYLTGKESVVIKVTKRPVPLVHLVYTKFGWIFGEELPLSKEDEFHILKLNKMKRRDNKRFRGREVYQTLCAPISHALEQKMGPIVVYAGRRGDVEGLALSFSKQFKKDSFGEDIDKLKERIKSLSGFEYVPAELQKLVTKYGIAYHHSGMIPPGRVAIETLLKEGLLRVCCGTMGISLGVNFAVRSAFISDESRPSEGGETIYSNTEIMQMLGRAGRRGHDSQGFSLWLNVGRYIAQKPKEREKCKSSLKFDPTTVIGILGQHQSIAYLSMFYQKSFFMRTKDSAQVFVADHDLISATLYQKYELEKIECEDIPNTYKMFQSGKKRSTIACNRCVAKKVCHNLMQSANQSMLNKIIQHLQDVNALDGSVPTLMGNLARHFPQAGGLIIANWLAQGLINKDTFSDYLQAMSAFGAAHFKEIPTTFADTKFLNDLEIPKLINKYYPNYLFPELYDEIKPKKWEENTSPEITFREFNLGAASIVKQWLNPRTKWEDLVEEHSSKYFSAGDCMNVLFRFYTFLQSCTRLIDFDPALAAEAKRLQKILLREPLDARNRMLVEETDEIGISSSEEEAVLTI
ncbi:DEAD/DEAH box helicase [Pigmentibacter ruber]